MNLIKTQIGLLAVAALVFVSFTKLKVTAYKVDTSKSTARWTGKKVTGEHSGVIPLYAGQLDVEGKNIKGGIFELNVAALTVTDIADKETNAKLVGHLKNDDFFSTDKHPIAKFVLTSAQQKQGNQYELSGNLTIKGITKPVSFPASIDIDAKGLNATAKITINRTAFDIRYRSSNFFENLGDKAIHDDFTIDVNLTARAQ
jgi:polyisoprenoid-binding protein YceI